MGVRVKGQALVAFERTLLELKGERAMDALAPHLPDDLRQALRNREILPMGWYPIEWFATLHAAGQIVHGAGISREIGRVATRHDVTTLYRFILRFLSPDTLVSQMSRILRMVVDSGEVVVDQKGNGAALVRFTGCHGSTRGTWDDMLGSIEVLLELCGGREVSARVVAGGGDGDGAMSCQLSWRT